ncbi:MAG: hypothetical protein AAFV72_00155 [Cyanobacteria bacterium J06635_1]
MTDSTKATRATVQIGAGEVDGFRLSDGTYRINLSQTGEMVGKTAQGVSNFLKSKTLKRLLGEDGGISNFLDDQAVNALASEGYTPDIFTVDIGPGGTQGQTRIRGLPLEMVSLYWIWEAYRGNKQAVILVMSLAIESLERRFDSAFGVQRTEDEYNQVLVNRVRELETSMTRLGEAMAEPDIRSEEIERLRQQIRDMGGEPFEEVESREDLI